MKNLEETLAPSAQVQAAPLLEERAGLCNVVQDVLPLYHDRVCSAASSALVESHLADCPACRAVWEKMQAEGCEKDLWKETGQVVLHQAKAQRRKALIAGSWIGGILCIPVLVCLIVNLAVGRALDWFFIVLASLLVFASLTVVPLLAEKHKTFCTMGAFTSSLLLLLGVCALYTGGGWFWVTASSVLFGLAVAFMPFVACLGPWDGFWKRNKGLLVFGVDTLLLVNMLVTIGLDIQDPVYWVSTPPVLLVTAGFVWVLFLICRYLRLDKLVSAGVSCILTGAYSFLINNVINVVTGGEWLPLPVMNLGVWNPSTLDGNVKWLILLSLTVVGLILGAVGLVRMGRKK